MKNSPTGIYSGGYFDGNKIVSSLLLFLKFSSDLKVLLNGLASSLVIFDACTLLSTMLFERKLFDAAFTLSISELTAALSFSSPLYTLLSFLYSRKTRISVKQHLHNI